MKTPLWSDDPRLHEAGVFDTPAGDAQAVSRFAACTTADLQLMQDEYHTRCSQFGETLTEREYADYCAINTELGRRLDPDETDALAAEEEDRITEGDPFDYDALTPEPLVNADQCAAWLGSERVGTERAA